MLESYPDLLSLKDLEEILHAKRYTALRLMHEELDSFKVGGKWLITKESLVEYIKYRVSEKSRIK